MTSVGFAPVTYNRIKCKKEYVFIVMLFGFLQLFFEQNIIVGYVLSAVEVLIILFFLIKRQVAVSFSIYLILVVLSPEYYTAVSNTPLYNIRTIGFGGVTFSTLVLFIIMLYCLFRGVNFHKIKKENIAFYKFSVFMMIINIVALINGVFCLITNNNGILNLNSSISKFIGEIYTFFYVPLGIFIVFFYVWSWEKEKFSIIKLALVLCFFGCFSEMLTSLIFQIRASYGGIDSVILVPSFAFLYPFFIILVNEISTNKAEKIFNYICAFVGTALLITFGSNGKNLMFAFLAIFCFIYLILKKESFSKKMIALIFAILVLIIFIDLYNNSDPSSLLKNKADQLFSVFDFFNPNWLDNLPTSPRVRVEEFINLGYEYLNNPLLVFGGKGFLGTIKDYTSYFQTLNWDLTSYSLDEWTVNSFYGLHDGARSILVYGLNSIVLYIIILVYYRRNNKGRSIGFSIIGFLWLVILNGFSFSLELFGCTALFISFATISRGTQK